MRFKVLLGAGALATGSLAADSAAAEVARTEICRKGEDSRVIEILAPGTVGAACDVRYVRDGGAKVTTPYNANSDRNFCRARAAELVATLIAEGFECSTPALDAIEAALAGGAPKTPEASLETLDAQLAAMENRGAGEAAPALEKLDQPPMPDAAASGAPPSTRRLHKSPWQKRATSGPALGGPARVRGSLR